MQGGIVALPVLRFGMRVPNWRSFLQRAALTRPNGCRYSSRKEQVATGETTMDPRYPIGDFAMPAQVSPARRQQAIEEIAATPLKMRAAVKGLNDAQLDTPYREGGWTVRQLVHHVPDSHLNAYVRLKLALTEEKPTIKP